MRWLVCAFLVRNHQRQGYSRKRICIDINLVTALTQICEPRCNYGFRARVGQSHYIWIITSHGYNWSHEGVSHTTLNHQLPKSRSQLWLKSGQKLIHPESNVLAQHSATIFEVASHPLIFMLDCHSPNADMFCIFADRWCRFVRSFVVSNNFKNYTQYFKSS